MEQSFAHSSKPVVAAIDGSADGERAIRFALEEARRRGTGVRIVYAVYELVATGATTSMTLAVSGLHDVGAQILKTAVDLAQVRAPDVFVESNLLTGHPVGAITRESADAVAVVVGTRAWNLVQSFGGSTTAGVATHADCPVYAVPPTWREGSTRGRIVVGVDSFGEPEAVLERALAEAGLRAAELTVTHAWAKPHHLLDTLADIDREHWQRGARASVGAAVDEARQRHPAIVTHLDIDWRGPAAALADASVGADLLVLGRHRGRLPFVRRLGSVAHHLLHTSQVPLEIVPITHDRGDRP